MQRSFSLKKKKKRTKTDRFGQNRTDINFVLIERNDRKYLNDVKAIPGNLQHALAVAVINKNKLERNATNNKVERRRVWKLKDKYVRKNFDKKVEELVNVEAPNSWKSYKEVQKVIASKNEMFKILSNCKSEENRTRYNTIRKKNKDSSSKSNDNESLERNCGLKILIKFSSF